MSDWESRRFPYQPKRPPPEHGIRMKKAGTTWWGQRWIEALEHVLGADARRLERGRTYARAGRAHDLVVRDGAVTAKVTGSRPQPYDVRIALSQLDAEQWHTAIAGMAGKAQFSAELLAGQMPTAIDEVFVAAGASLFPTQRSDLVTSCSCPDWGDPCKHVAATHYVLGEALDRDPFVLFELRGKPQGEVLDALRTARAGSPAGEANVGHASPRASDASSDEEVPRVTLELSADDYDRPRALPALQFSFDEPPAQGALLRQLGAPPTWRSEDSPAASFESWIRDAARVARRLALAESAATEPAPVEPAPTAEAPAGRAPAKRGSAAPARAQPTRVSSAASAGTRKKKKKKQVTKRVRPTSASSRGPRRPAR
jgi:uncharacterized Zn finger protein